MTDDLLPLTAVVTDSTALVGGKALSLAQLIRAELPVPPGFCVTTVAHRRQHLDADAVRTAYRELGGGLVAVRSSATAEDGDTSSFAGQQDTFLGVVGEEALLDAIRACWASIDGARAIAYRRAQGIGDVTMAVVVQRLISAEVAGVLFTSDPLGSHKQMLVEASWGLGESVVGGTVVPDRFTLDFQTGHLIECRIGSKTTRRDAGAGTLPVESKLQNVACLDAAQLEQLAELGRRVEAFFGGPRDVEWAFADGRFWLLQARPITASGLEERDAVLREEIAALKAQAAPGGTVWSRFNLSEILPEPTPMTWAIVRGYLVSGGGGWGRMVRDLGFDPSPTLDSCGVFDLVCGRPYCNLSREPLLHFHRVPLTHCFKELKADPRRALYPVPRLDLWSSSPSFWFTWPLELWAMSAATRKQRANIATFARRYRDHIAPAFRAWCAAAADPATLDDTALVSAFNETVRRTFVEFARDSLKPTALAALCLAELEEELASIMPRAAAGLLTRDLVMGVHPDPDADLAGAVRDLAAGHLAKADFLARFGHRGNEEMELSKPRWSDDATTLDHLAEGERIAAGERGVSTPRFAVTDMPVISHPDALITQRLEACTHLTCEQWPLIVPRVRVLHEYLGLRETAKNDLMRGIAQMRRLLLELDRRRSLGGGVFFLTPDELPRLLAGHDLGPTIAKRRRRRALALGLECPPVLFSDDLDAIGRPITIDNGDSIEGVPLSAGVVEGPALVLDHPESSRVPADGTILVCPSTDPAWVPLFVYARGLVMETGGVLSHGAIVAREFGLPAVAGIPAVTRRIVTGQRIRVDGTRGVVTLIPSELPSPTGPTARRPTGSDRR